MSAEVASAVACLPQSKDADGMACREAEVPTSKIMIEGTVPVQEDESDTIGTDREEERESISDGKLMEAIKHIKKNITEGKKTAKPRNPLDEAKIKCVIDLRRKKMFRFRTPGRPSRSIFLKVFAEKLQPCVTLERLDVAKEQQKLLAENLIEAAPSSDYRNVLKENNMRCTLHKIEADIDFTKLTELNNELGSTALVESLVHSSAINALPDSKSVLAVTTKAADEGVLSTLQDAKKSKGKRSNLVRIPPCLSCGVKHRRNSKRKCDTPMWKENTRHKLNTYQSKSIRKVLQRRNKSDREKGFLTEQDILPDLISATDTTPCPDVVRHMELPENGFRLSPPSAAQILSSTNDLLSASGSAPSLKESRKSYTYPSKCSRNVGGVDDGLFERQMSSKGPLVRKSRSKYPPKSHRKPIRIKIQTKDKLHRIDSNSTKVEGNIPLFSSCQSTGEQNVDFCQRTADTGVLEEGFTSNVFDSAKGSNHSKRQQMLMTFSKRETGADSERVANSFAELLVSLSPNDNADNSSNLPELVQSRLSRTTPINRIPVPVPIPVPVHASRGSISDAKGGGSGMDALNSTIVPRDGIACEVVHVLQDIIDTVHEQCQAQFPGNNAGKRKIAEEISSSNRKNPDNVSEFMDDESRDSQHMNKLRIFEDRRLERIINTLRNEHLSCGEVATDRSKEQECPSPKDNVEPTGLGNDELLDSGIDQSVCNQGSCSEAGSHQSSIVPADHNVDACLCPRKSLTKRDKKKTQKTSTRVTMTCAPENEVKLRTKCKGGKKGSLKSLDTKLALSCGDQPQLEDPSYPNVTNPNTEERLLLDLGPQFNWLEHKILGLQASCNGSNNATSNDTDLPCKSSLEEAGPGGNSTTGNEPLTSRGHMESSYPEPSWSVKEIELGKTIRVVRDRRRSPTRGSPITSSAEVEVKAGGRKPTSCQIRRSRRARKHRDIFQVHDLRSVFLKSKRSRQHQKGNPVCNKKPAGGGMNSPARTIPDKDVPRDNTEDSPSTAHDNCQKYTDESSTFVQEQEEDPTTEIDKNCNLSNDASASSPQERSRPSNDCEEESASRIEDSTTGMTTASREHLRTWSETEKDIAMQILNLSKYNSKGSDEPRASSEHMSSTVGDQSSVEAHNPSPEGSGGADKDPDISNEQPRCAGTSLPTSVPANVEFDNILDETDEGTLYIDETIHDEQHEVDQTNAEYNCILSPNIGECTPGGTAAVQPDSDTGFEREISTQPECKSASMESDMSTVLKTDMGTTWEGYATATHSGMCTTLQGGTSVIQVSGVCTTTERDSTKDTTQEPSTCIEGNTAKHDDYNMNEGDTATGEPSTFTALYGESKTQPADCCTLLERHTAAHGTGTCTAPQGDTAQEPGVCTTPQVCAIAELPVAHSELEGGTNTLHSPCPSLTLSERDTSLIYQPGTLSNSNGNATTLQGPSTGSVLEEDQASKKTDTCTSFDKDGADSPGSVTRTSQETDAVSTFMNTDHTPCRNTPLAGCSEANVRINGGITMPNQKHDTTEEVRADVVQTSGLGLPVDSGRLNNASETIETNHQAKIHYEQQQEEITNLSSSRTRIDSCTLAPIVKTTTRDSAAMTEYSRNSRSSFNTKNDQPPKAHSRETSAKVIVKTGPPAAHTRPVNFGAYTNMKFSYLKEKSVREKIQSYSGRKAEHVDDSLSIRSSTKRGGVSCIDSSDESSPDKKFCVDVQYAPDEALDMRKRSASSTSHNSDVSELEDQHSVKGQANGEVSKRIPSPEYASVAHTDEGNMDYIAETAREESQLSTWRLVDQMNSMTRGLTPNAWNFKFSNTWDIAKDQKRKSALSPHTENCALPCKRQAGTDMLEEDFVSKPNSVAKFPSGQCISSRNFLESNHHMVDPSTTINSKIDPTLHKPSSSMNVLPKNLLASQRRDVAPKTTASLDFLSGGFFESTNHVSKRANYSFSNPNLALSTSTGNMFSKELFDSNYNTGGLPKTSIYSVSSPNFALTNPSPRHDAYHMAPHPLTPHSPVLNYFPATATSTETPASASVQFIRNLSLPDLQASGKPLNSMSRGRIPTFADTNSAVHSRDPEGGPTHYVQSPLGANQKQMSTHSFMDAKGVARDFQHRPRSESDNLLTSHSTAEIRSTVLSAPPASSTLSSMSQSAISAMLSKSDRVKAAKTAIKRMADFFAKKHQPPPNSVPEASRNGCDNSTFRNPVNGASTTQTPHQSICGLPEGIAKYGLSNIASGFGAQQNYARQRQPDIPLWSNPMHGLPHSSAVDLLRQASQHKTSLNQAGISSLGAGHQLSRSAMHFPQHDGVAGGLRTAAAQSKLPACSPTKNNSTRTSHRPADHIPRTESGFVGQDRVASSSRADRMGLPHVSKDAYQMFNVGAGCRSRPYSDDQLQFITSRHSHLEYRRTAASLPQAAKETAVGSLHCDTCMHPAVFLCSGCRKEAYCSARCQLMAWGRHRILCEGSRFAAMHGMIR